MQKAAPGAWRERGEEETSLLLLCGCGGGHFLPYYVPWCKSPDRFDLYQHSCVIPGTFSVITEQSSHFNVIPSLSRLSLSPSVWQQILRTAAFTGNYRSTVSHSATHICSIISAKTHATSCHLQTHILQHYYRK